MIRTLALTVFIAALLGQIAFADELTEIVQQDLTSLGYDTGNTSGELSMETTVAISKFQSENNLDVTGEPSPQLAGIIKARLSPQLKPSLPADQDPATLQAAQQSCLREKVTAAQQTQKKKRGLGSLMRAVSRTAAQVGGFELGNKIAKVSGDVYAADATAKDLKRAAKDLGLTEDDVEACRNP